MSTATEVKKPEVQKEVQKSVQIQYPRKEDARQEDPRPTTSPVLPVRAEWFFNDVLLETSGPQRKRRTLRLDKRAR